MDIISKFTIGTEEGINTLFRLRKAQIREMYSQNISEGLLADYITSQLDHKEAILELNNLSTQMLTVFSKEVPVGYVIIKQMVQPEILKDKKVIKLDPFYVHSEHNLSEVRDSLWTKTLSLTRNYDAIWLEVLQSDPMIPYLKDWGFKVEEDSKLQPFDQPSYLMVRWKENE